MYSLLLGMAVFNPAGPKSKRRLTAPGIGLSKKIG
jgi:hypothetical protein